jgi:hypothetical protein
MNVITAPRTGIHSYYKAIMGGKEKVVFASYRLDVNNDYERQYIQRMDNERERLGLKPVFYVKEDGDFYINVVDKGNGVPSQLTVTLILRQVYGVTEESIKLTKHFA